ncbi:MAG TPA: HEAT repeat domain-containing protein [Candidatus Rifleibacterium sp.]|nr:HEAT repeat domain-containing protein [Candidatus Rifleibacterium sp.]HPT44391.1 HEAT repeat domain-containing protein [Candidatus Rifleibacterium sp.]
MNEIAQKRIRDVREKISAAIHSHLGGKFSEEIKAKLVLLMAEVGLNQSIGSIFSYLQTHPDQEEAIIAANKFEAEEIQSFLLELLKNSRSAHREVIVECLGNRKKLALVPELKQFLADADRQVRFQAANSLFNIGGKEAALAMCEFVSDPDEWISMTILRLLCIMRELDSIPILIEKYHQDEDLRRKALMISFLARFRSVTLLGIFDQGLQARDARLRANSIEAVGNLNLPENEIKNRIEPSLHDPNNRIRANSILALARLNPEKIKPEIVDMVNSSDVQLRRSAAFILGMIPSTEYQDLASILVTDMNEVVRKRMIQSLRNFPSDFVLNQLEKALSDNNKWIRKHAVDMASRIANFPHKKILGLLKTERAAPNLEACLNFFASHPIDEAMSAIKLHVKDRRLQVVKALLAAVAAIGGVEGVKSVAPRLEQKDPGVIQVLSEVLIKAGDRKILDDLVERFTKVRHENQVSVLIPSLISSVRILDQGDNMPEQLLHSLETIEVEEKPREPVKIPEPEQQPEERPADQSAEQKPAEENDGQLDLSMGLLDLPVPGGAEASEGPREDEDEGPGEDRKVSSHYRQGLKAYNIGKYKKAISEFNKVLETDDQPPENVFLYMGIMLADQEQFEPARNYLQTFIEKVPDHARANFLLGRVYRQLKNWSGIIRLYTRFTNGELEASPKMKKRIYHDLGMASVLVGQYDEGAKLLDALLKMDPENGEALYYLAFAKYSLRQTSEAESLLPRAEKYCAGNKRISKLIEALSRKLKGGTADE